MSDAQRQVSMYMLDSGQIIGRASLGEGASASFPGAAEIDGWYDSGLFYVDIAAGEVRPRPPCPAQADRTTVLADGDDAALIAPCPAGSEVRVDGGPWRAVDGDQVQFAAEHAGIYQVEIRCWPHIEAAFTIEATQP